MRSVNLPDDPVYAQFRFDAAREYPASATQLVVSGQIGDVHGDFAAQLSGALDALATVLAAADYTLADIARLGIFTTDVDAFVAHWQIVRERFAPDAVPPNTLVQVARLVSPHALLEIEALAVR